MTESTGLDLTKLSAGDLAKLYGQFKAMEAAEREARKAEREQSRAFVGKLVRIVSEKFPARTMKSGAEGWSLGGKDIDVEFSDGSTRKYRVSILIRAEDSIPASDKSGSDDDDQE